MALVHDILVRKLKEHTRISSGDADALGRLPFEQRPLPANADIVRQGDQPRVSVFVLRGMLARYHTRPGGGRQYLSFHISGDMPDLQALFLDVMDHSVCAIDDAEIALVLHSEILDLFERRPPLGFALWRETLIDAAIFREAITNNSARPPRIRMAHFFCEQYYRAKAGGLASQNSCSLPLSQMRLGETLGISVVTTNRMVQSLRRSGAVDWRDGVLTVRNWRKLTEIGEFDAGYLHLTRQSRI
jgi:CRP-like cAMP-binding protein